MRGPPIAPRLAAIPPSFAVGDALFIGHFAIAFAAKRVAPAVSLGAIMPLDFVHYPYSHSLVALIAWSAGFAVLYGLRRHVGAGTLWVLAVVVLSHWLLDVLSHRPDMPLTLGGDARVGLGLWFSKPATIAVEVPLFIGAALLYARTTTALDATGRYALWALVAFLLVVYLANAFGPPPPSSAAIAWSAEAIWLLVACGYWVDRHRARASAHP